MVKYTFILIVTRPTEPAGGFGKYDVMGYQHLLYNILSCGTWILWLKWVDIVDSLPMAD